MITLAKVAVTRKYGEEATKAGAGAGAKVRGPEEEESRQVQSPSLMQMACNTMEAHRLRSDLVALVHETDVLSAIYTEQLIKTQKTAMKLVSRDAIAFETATISKDGLNLVDQNDGSKLGPEKMDLAVMEFDATLGASLDFRSESCMKALMTDLGVEELRAAVHYQLM